MRQVGQSLVPLDEVHTSPRGRSHSAREAVHTWLLTLPSRQYSLKIPYTVASRGPPSCGITLCGNHPCGQQRPPHRGRWPCHDL